MARSKANSPTNCGLRRRRPERFGGLSPRPDRRCVMAAQAKSKAARMRYQASKGREKASSKAASAASEQRSSKGPSSKRCHKQASKPATRIRLQQRVVECARRYGKLVQTEKEAVGIFSPNRPADGPPESLPLVTTQKETLEGGVCAGDERVSSFRKQRSQNNVKKLNCGGKIGAY